MVAFRRKSVTFEGVTYVYAETGEINRGRHSLLLLHGFSTDKYSWGSFVVHLPADAHAVALDLPGHGGTTKPDLAEFQFTDFTKAVSKFVEAVFPVGHCLHVIGQSMGGTIAGDFAADRPDRVAQLTLVCPSMKTPVTSEFRKIYETTGKCMWFPETLEDYKTMQTYVYYKPPADVMDAILVEMLDMMKARFSYNKQLYSLVVAENTRTLLERRSGEIRVPVLVVWGADDKTLDVSGAETLNGMLKDCRVKVFQECGHAVNKDKSKELADVIMEFQEEISRNAIADIV